MIDKALPGNLLKESKDLIPSLSPDKDLPRPIRLFVGESGGMLRTGVMPNAPITANINHVVCPDRCYNIAAVMPSSTLGEPYL